jgi:rhomboid family GlyGly-CTERM serine protease
VSTLDKSPPERVALGAAIALLALQALGAGERLEWRRGLLAAEPWRVVTGHLVHIGWLHALVNALALVVVARLYAPDLGVRRQLAALAASALAVSAALAWLYPEIEWYRGLSGALHGLYFAGAMTWLLSEPQRNLRKLWLPAALVAGGWIKVALEQPVTGSVVQAEWLGAAIVPQAHLVGAACGTLLGALFAAANARSERQKREH